MTIEKTMTAMDLKLTPPKELSADQRKAWDAYYEPRNSAFRASDLKENDLVRWRYQRYMHDYLGCIKAVDESVGRVLEFLDKEGLADNTIVVYSADQGFFLGEHGWFDKRWIFEESLRAPLLVRWPGVVRGGTVSSSLVSNIDFAPTFLDAAGVPLPSGVQGRSLVSILEGETPKDWRTSFYYQYFEYPVPHHVRPHFGVITDRFKLVRFDRPDLDEWELFDRMVDPAEMRSLYHDPAYRSVTGELKRELDRLRDELKVPAQFPAEAYGNVSHKSSEGSRK
jgi:arylsulfatase A-like enzyme